MNAMKSIGSTILGIAIFIALMFALVLFIEGAAKVSAFVFPLLVTATELSIAICIAVFLPLALFKFTRIVSVWGFFVASYIFGLSVWIFGFLVTYELWGGSGVFVGMVLGFVGVVPMGIIASALKGLWIIVIELIFGIFLTYGTRTFAMYLANKIDLAAERAGQQSADLEILSESESQ